MAEPIAPSTTPPAPEQKRAWTKVNLRLHQIAGTNGKSNFTSADFLHLGREARDRVCIYLRALRSEQSNGIAREANTLRITAPELEHTLREFLTGNPRIAREIHELHPMRKLNETLNHLVGISGYDNFDDAQFAALNPARRQKVVETLTKLGDPPDMSYARALGTYVGLTVTELQTAASQILGRNRTMRQAVLAPTIPASPVSPSSNLGEGLRKPANDEVEWRKFNQALNKLASVDGPADFTRPVFEKLNPGPATAVLDFLREVRLWVAPDVLAELGAHGLEKAAKRAGMEPNELKHAAAEFFDSNAWILLEIKAHRAGSPRKRDEIRNARKELEKIEATGTSRSVSHADSDRPTDDSAERWTAMVDHAVTTWTQAKDDSKINTIITHVKENGPTNAPGLRLVKPRIYDVHSAAGNDFRIVGVLKGHTLAFQAVYKHGAKGTGKQLIAGKEVPGY